jgi:geranylgeranyl pyrophosphate synthase
LAEFGLGLGLCFQIVDDLLDFTGSEQDLGKPVLSDLAEGRVTLPLIYALRTDGRPYRDRIAGLIRRKDITAGEKDDLLGLLTTSGAFDYTMTKAGEYLERALAVLGRFPDSSPRRGLAALARLLIDRKQ